MAEKYKNIKHPIRNEWAWSLMKDVVYISSGNTLKGINDVKLKPHSNIDFYKVSDMNTEGNEKYMKDSALKVTLSEASSLKLKLEEPNTIIFPKRGGAILTNKKRILSKKSAYDLNLMGVKEKSEIIENRFLWFWFQKLDLSRLYDGSSVPQINNKNIEPLWFPVAPLPEQRATVSKIEQLFSDLDNGIENFKKAQEQLKRYRQSVLKAACEGKLVPTEAELAHADGRDYEPANVLLARILKERREKWDGKGKYKEAAAPDMGGLPELPEGWVWTTINQLAASEAYAITDGPFGSNLKTSHYTEMGPRVIRLQNIGDGLFNNAYAHISQQHYDSLSKHRVQAGDLVIAALGEHPPRACIIPPSVGPAIVKADCIRFKPDNELALNIFLNCALNSEPTRTRTACVIHGMGRPRLNLGEIKSILLPLPPPTEQRRIVTEVERRLSVSDKMEETIAESLQKSEVIRQSILKKAFEGKLLSEKELEEVRNAPDWEPAEKLLERIKAEKNN